IGAGEPPTLRRFPLRLEGRALRSRKIAMAGPAGGKRQPCEAPPPPSYEPQQPRRRSGRDAIEPRPFGEERPEGEARTHGRRRQMLLELAFAPRTHHPGERDTHRTHFLTAPAKGRGVRQMAGPVDADQAWRQYRAHRPRIDPPVRMPADRMIDRAMIHAGAAADTAQHVAERAAKHR